MKKLLSSIPLHQILVFLLFITITNTVFSQYCNPSTGSSNYQYISRVTVGTLAHSSGGGGGSVVDLTGVGNAEVSEGTSVPITVNVSSIWTGTNDDLHVYVDWNGDGDFTDAGELEVQLNELVAGASHTFNGTISVPAGQALGNYRMRVGYSWRDGMGSDDGCRNVTGEWEDYTLEVVPPITEQYCSASVTNSAGSLISNVTIGTLNNSSGGGCETYSDFSGAGTPVLDINENYDISVTVGSCDAATSQSTRVYMDWNRDGDFDDAGELVVATGTVASGSTVAGSITVPPYAVTGNAFGMRVITMEAPQTHSSACDVPTNGEVEDYLVSVNPNPEIHPPVGVALDMGDQCYELTQESTSDVGAIWFNDMLDLSVPFDIRVNLNFGDHFCWGCGADPNGIYPEESGGADGIAFVMQQESNSAGNVGQGMGYGDVQPSLAVEFDTYYNFGSDPLYDHIGIAVDGNTDLTDCAPYGPNSSSSLCNDQMAGNINARGGINNTDLLVPAMGTDPTVNELQTGADFPVRFTWDPATDLFEVWFNGVKKISLHEDVIATIFGDDPEVFFGFSSATGSEYNYHRVCLDYNSTLTEILDPTICEGETTPLNMTRIASDPTPVTYTWSTVTGSPASTSLSATDIPNPIATPTITTTYAIAINMNDIYGVAGIINDTVTVTVIDAIEASNVTTVCNGDGTYTLSFMIANGDPNTYNVTGVTGTITGSGVTRTFTSDPIPANTPYNLTISDAGGCPPVDYSGNQACDNPCTAYPLVNAGSVATICIDETHDLTDAMAIDAVDFLPLTDPSKAGLLWTTTSGSFDDATSQNPIFTPAGPGTFTLTITGYSGEVDQVACPDASATVDITVIDLPTPTDQTETVCEDTQGSGTAAGIDLTSFEAAIDGGAGNTITWYSDAGLSTVIPDVTDVTVTNGGIYYADVDNGTCNVTATVTYTVDPIPAAPAVTDQTICFGAATPDLTAVGSNLNWYSDNALTTNVNTGTNYATGETAVGSYPYYVTQTVNGCVSPPSTVTLTIDEMPDITVTDPAPVCDPLTVDITTTFVDNNTTSGTATYWQDAGATTTEPNPTAITTTGIYYVQIETTPACVDIQPINVTVNTPPTPTDQTATTCEDIPGSGTTAGIDITTFNGVIDGGGNTVTWYSDAGLTTTVTTPTNLTVSDGDIFYAEVDDGNCTSVATLTYTVAATIAVNDQTPVLCEDTQGSGTAAGINLTAMDVAVGSGNTVTWYSDAGYSILVPDATSVTVSNGTIFYPEVTQGNCRNTGIVTYTINAIPPAPPITDETICFGTATPDLTATGTDLNWYSDAGLTTNIGTGTTYATGETAAGTYTYYVTETVNGCVSPPSPVVLTINQMPDIVVTDPPSACDPSTVDITGAFVDNNATGGIVTYWSDAGATTSIPDPTAIPITGTYYIQIEATGVCIAIQPVNVTVNTPPSATVTNPALTCNISAGGSIIDFSTLVTSGDLTGTWNDDDGSGATGSFPNLDFDGTIPGTYNFTYTTNSAPAACAEVSYPINVIVQDCNCPSVATIPPDELCDDGSSTDLTALVLSVEAGTWAITNTPGGGNPATLTGTVFDATGADAGTYELTFTLDVPPPVGCPDSSVQDIVINSTPILVITDPAPVCDPLIIDLTDPAITTGSSLFGATLTYYTSSADATAGTNAILATAINTSGTYYVRAETSTIPSCVSTAPIVVTINPTPSITVTDPATVCAPGSVDVTGTFVDDNVTGGTVTYWQDAGAIIPVADETAIAITGTYYVQIQTTAGCSDIQPINVVISPVPDLSITDPAAVCQPNTVDITTTFVDNNAATGTVTYWQDAAATIVVSDPTAIAASGTYYIQKVAGNCSDIDPVNVIVNPTPSITVIDPAGVCDPNTVDVTNAFVDDNATGGTVTYWQDAGATIPVADETTIATTGTYYVQIQTAEGCTDIQGINVEIYATPSLTITDPAGVCDPETVDITGTFVDNNTTTGTITYWQDANATTPIADEMGIPSSGTYYVQKETAEGCLDIQPVNVTVNPTPDLIVASPVELCEPNTFDFTGAVTDNNNTTGTYTYWQDINGTIPVTDETAIPVTGTYYVVKQTAAGCVDADSVQVTIKPIPQFTVTPGEVCPGEILTMDVNPINQYDEDVYDWYTDSLAGTLAYSGGSYTTNELFESITYWVEPSRGCKGSRVRVDLIIHPFPVAEFTTTTEEIIDLETDVDFVDISTGGTTGIWDFGDQTGQSYLPGQDTVKHHYSITAGGGIPDEYVITLSLESDFGCPATTELIIPVNLDWAIYIPKAFTPGNKDGINDDFLPKGFGILEMKMWIFNRWGDNIYYTGDQIPWDGRDHLYQLGKNNITSDDKVKEDTYVYKVQILNVFMEKHTYVGEINLIR